jgi:hypothetical protein
MTRKPRERDMAYRDPEIVQLRALLAGLVTPPGAPRPTVEEQRATYEGFGLSLPPPCR